MVEKLKPIYAVNTKMKIEPYECKIVNNMRTIIKVKINEDSDKKAVVIGINPSVACEKKATRPLRKSAGISFSLG